MLSRPSNQIDLVALTTSHLSTSSTVVQFSENGCVMSSTELFNLSKYHHALSRLLSSLVSREKDVTLSSKKLLQHYPHLSDFKNTGNHHS